MSLTRRAPRRSAPLLAACGLSLLVVLLVVAAPAAAQEVVSGNPSCQELGYDYGFKPQPEPPPSGTYSFPGVDDTVTITSDGVTFDWTSTLGVDAVIVKGGSDAHVYAYDPEAFSGVNLSSPDNASGGAAAISHIEFCYDFELSVSKTATTTYTRSWPWSIDKTVTPETIDLFLGDWFQLRYVVSVDRGDPQDSDFAVSGTITISNDTPFDATGVTVTDEMTGGIVADVTCPVALPADLGAGQSWECSYASMLPGSTPRTNVATVATAAGSPVSGSTAEEAVAFGAPTVETNASITVVDESVDESRSWMFSNDGSQSYSATYRCAESSKTYVNTATIVETGQTAQTTVPVTCRQLTVTKTAASGFDRAWDWTISKTADHEDLLLSPNQSATVVYTVDVTATPANVDHHMTGTVTVGNPHPTLAAPLDSVRDYTLPSTGSIAFDIPLANCTAAVVPAMGSVTCDYDQSLTADELNAAVQNVAEATLVNRLFAPGADPVVLASRQSFESAPVAIDHATDPGSEIDSCVDITDEYLDGADLQVDTLAEDVCGASLGPDGWTTSYEVPVGPFGVASCADNGGLLGALMNTARLTTGDSATTEVSTWAVNVQVACEDGCTLTQGYWKTHADPSRKQYDSTWGEVMPAGPDSLFLASGETWLQVLETPPKGGNVFYILAHQYIAASLNVLAGADSGIIAEELAEAEALLWTVDDPKKVRIKGDEKNEWIKLAALLDLYNNGDLGPGHCSEEPPEDPVCEPDPE